MPQVCFDASVMRGEVIATEAQLFEEIRDIMYKRAGAGGHGSTHGRRRGGFHDCINTRRRPVQVLV